MRIRVILALFTACLLTGCHSASTPSPNTAPIQIPNAAATANKAFLNQTTFDPWTLTSTDPNNPLPAYVSNGKYGVLYDAYGNPSQRIQAGVYQNGRLVSELLPRTRGGDSIKDRAKYKQVVDMKTGACFVSSGGDYDSTSQSSANWSRIWQTSDIVIDGDPEAQQVTHANLFYLLSSTFPGSTFSIPPMGLSSSVYGGHIFWDADVWMLPALIVQQPEYAKPIVDYRFKLLGQAEKNAKMHGYAGAEYPWESADTGAEVVTGEFTKERHITADVAFAAWQWYLWTGDEDYLRNEGWPLLQATAQYWVSRVTKEADGKWHIRGVLSPDETAGVVDDDAYTNAVVQYNLQAAVQAARLLGQTPGPGWEVMADAMYIPFDKARGIPAENDKPLTDHFSAKQADTLLLIHPLGVRYDPAAEGKMLDFYAAHTTQYGPAMTSSIHAVVAARLGRAQQSLDYFHDSYRPFMRAPWDAFSEKRTTNNVYFLTGMAGCVQSILYGFAGLQVHLNGEKANGAKLAGDEVASLYADPHLPPGWGKLIIKGIRFRGKTLDLTVLPGNKIQVSGP